MTRSLSLAKWRYCIEPRTRKYVKGYGFIISCFQKVVPGAFLTNKIADPATKLNNEKIVEQEPVEEILFCQKKENKNWTN